MLKKLLITLVFVILPFIGAQTTFAASSYLSVRLQQPQSPTNQNNFTITFVALTTTGNPITVTCYKEGPTDGSFSEFGSPITLSSGGNTDNCNVDSSILSTAGTYSFYVIASDGTNTAQSSTVSVDFNNSNGPGTPGQYSKDQINSCTYKIGFQTADDGGKTVKIELYRSDSTSFSADNSTKVDSQSIGSNTSGSFTNAVPDCTKTWYFALRAFDSFGNGSGVIGDISTNTNTVFISGTPVPAQGAIPVTNGGNGGQGVLGAKTGPTPTGSVTGTQNQNNQNKGNTKEVKGETKSQLFSSSAWMYLGLAVLMVVVLIFVQRYFAKRRKSAKH